MIGQRVSGTLWSVVYRHNVLDEAGKPLPQQAATGRRIIITADPSGADLHEVARLAVLGNSFRPEHQFTVTNADQAGECQGLAMLPPSDQAWSAPRVEGVAEELSLLWELAELVESDDILRLKAWEQLGEAKAARERREGARQERGADNAS